MSNIEICSIEDCGRRVFKKTWCRAHFERAARSGDPLGKYAMRGEGRAWVLNHVNYDGEDCLIWPFKKKFPYDSARMMCIAAHGTKPSRRHEVTHSCGNGHLACVNPKHVSWQTHATNLGHTSWKIHDTRPKGENHPHSKLTVQKILKIRVLAARGTVSQSEIGEMFGIGQNNVSLIHRRKTWAWVPETGAR